MRYHNLFSEADIQAISEAIKQAESGISGEIVPVFIDECDNYLEATLKAFIVGVFTALLALVVIDKLTTNIFWYQPIWFFTIAMLGGLVFSIITFIFKPVKRLFIGEQLMLLRAQQKADTCFIAHKVYNTRQNTGIMIFIAFFEQIVIIKPDFAIDEKVTQAEWDNITALIIDGIRKKQAAKGIIEAINQCGALVKEKGFIALADDTNELENKIHFEGKK